jgi:hypothetical protein
VTEKSFMENDYKFFVGSPVKNKIKSYSYLEESIFHPAFDNQKKPVEFTFSYTIIAGSKNVKGACGPVHLKK